MKIPLSTYTEVSMAKIHGAMRKAVLGVFCAWSGAGCGQSGGQGGALCEVKAHANEPSMIKVTNNLDHFIFW